ncbi:MAG: hypothetical protein ACTSPQ_15085 [Candidatus Helarchaeota archaeon]
MKNLDSIKGILVHQVNCKKKIETDLSKLIFDKWPIAYDIYMIANLKPGMIQLVEANQNLIICNLAGQNESDTDKIYTDYNAVRHGFRILGKFAENRRLDIHVPVGIGCDKKSRGDWETYKNIVVDECPFVIFVDIEQFSS